MSNTEGNGDKAMAIGKTIRDSDNNSTALVIPKEFAKALGIKNSKVSISIINGFDGDRYLLISKYCREILID